MPEKVEYSASKFYLFLVLHNDATCCLRFLDLIDGTKKRK
jgi:hypothetical protein